MGGLANPFRTRSQLAPKPFTTGAIPTGPDPPWQRMLVQFNKPMDTSVLPPSDAYEITVDGELRINGDPFWVNQVTIRFRYSGLPPVTDGFWRYRRIIGAFQAQDGSLSRPTEVQQFA